MKISISFLLETNATQVPNVAAVPAPLGGIPADFKIGITAAYAVIFVVALFGNSLGLFLVLKKSSSANVTNLFIANMAFADLLLTLNSNAVFRCFSFSVEIFGLGDHLVP